MRRHAYRYRPVLALAALPLLAACGTETFGAAAPDRAELERRAAAIQTRVEHVYVTEADGFDLAEQSVGVIGDDGFSATYVAKKGGMITVTVERGEVTDATCRSLPGAAGGTECEKDGPGWYRSGGSGHEYLRTENGLRIRISTDSPAVDRDTLRAAAEKIHRADDRELDAVLPRATAPRRPVERGDLPSEGDGAPNNDVGASG